MHLTEGCSFNCFGRLNIYMLFIFLVISCSVSSLCITECWILNFVTGVESILQVSRWSCFWNIFFFLTNRLDPMPLLISNPLLFLDILLYASTKHFSLLFIFFFLNVASFVFVYVCPAVNHFHCINLNWVSTSLCLSITDFIDSICCCCCWVECFNNLIYTS